MADYTEAWGFTQTGSGFVDPESPQAFMKKMAECVPAPPRGYEVLGILFNLTVDREMVSYSVTYRKKGTAPNKARQRKLYRQYVAKHAVKVELAKPIKNPPK